VAQDPIKRSETFGVSYVILVNYVCLGNKLPS
jgi:hypothetical protein